MPGCKACQRKDKKITELSKTNNAQLDRLNALHLLKRRISELEAAEPPKAPPTPGGLTILISGEHNTGRSTLVTLLTKFLKETGYADVTAQDTAPTKGKEPFKVRWAKNRERPVRIYVATEIPSVSSR